MNVTFFIGNGFDLNLGLKTEYKSFLEDYIKNGNSGLLTDEIKKDIDKWSDLEMALGDYVQKNVHANDAAFIASKHDLDNKLAAYLTQEGKRNVIIDTNGAVEFRDRIVNIDHYLF